VYNYILPLNNANCKAPGFMLKILLNTNLCHVMDSQSYDDFSKTHT